MKPDVAEQLRLQIELLRTRGALERAEAALALAELRAGTRGVRKLAATAARAGTVAAALRQRAPGWLGMAAPLLLKQPAAVAAGLAALRWARGHPWLTALVAAVAGGTAWWLTRASKHDAIETPDGPQ